MINVVYLVVKKTFKNYNDIRFIHFFGADGVGKSTQANLLAYYFKKNCVDVKVVRIRSGRTIASIVYKILRTLTPDLLEYGGDGRVIRLYNIRNSFQKQMWSLIEFLSMIPYLLFSVYLPLSQKKIVVAERYIIDAIATIAFLIDDLLWPKSFLARCMLKFIPRNSVFIFLDASYKDISRRRGTRADQQEYIEFQRTIYRAYARALRAFKIDTSVTSIKETAMYIRKYLALKAMNKI